MCAKQDKQEYQVHTHAHTHTHTQTYPCTLCPIRQFRQTRPGLPKPTEEQARQGVEEEEWRRSSSRAPRHKENRQIDQSARGGSSSSSDADFDRNSCCAFAFRAVCVLLLCACVCVCVSVVMYLWLGKFCLHVCVCLCVALYIFHLGENFPFI